MSGLEKAKLIEIEPIPQSNPQQQPTWKIKDGGQTVVVQFNPESLKLTYANQLEQAKGGDQASGNGGRQFVGAGTTKLALQLWFDVTAMQENPVDDVRRLTQKVLYFMIPQKSKDDPKKLTPPGTRFSWGSFQFDGLVEGMEENIEFFSPEGKPLRASISLTLSQQKILEAEFKGDGNVPKLPGRNPLTSAKAGDSLQNMAAKSGKGDWQSIAAANGIEDPLRMSPGQLINLNAGLSGGIGVSGGLGGSIGFGGSVAISGNVGSKSTGLNASLTGGVSGSLNFNR